MAHIIPNAFTSYDLNIQEQEEGSLLTIGQKQVIQNQIAELAEQQLALEPNIDNQLEFIQQQAHKQGEIAALRFLIACSESIEEAKRAGATILENQQP